MLTLPVGFGAILNASTPLFTALLGVIWLGDRLSARMLLGLGIGVAAVVVLVGWSPLEVDLATLVAVLAALGAAMGYAFGGTFVKRRLPGVGGTELATGQLTAGAIILLPFALASGAPGTPSPTAALSLLAVGTLSTALPWPIYMRLLRSTSPTIASSVTFVVPAFAITWGAIVLGESIGPELVIGFGMIIVSLVLVLGLGRERLRLPHIGPWSERAVAEARFTVGGARLVRTPPDPPPPDQPSFIAKGGAPPLRPSWRFRRSRSCRGLGLYAQGASGPVDSEPGRSSLG